MLNTGKSKQYGISAGGKTCPASINIGRHQLNPMFSAVSNIAAHLAPVSVIARHHRCHKFRTEIGFQIGGLPGYPCVTYGMRLIKSISCKMNHQVKHMVGHFAAYSLLFRAFQECLPLCQQHIRLFMPHGTAKKVRLSKTEPAHNRRDSHNLFLIKDNPIGFLQYRLQHRMRIFYRNLPMFSFYKIFSHTAAKRSRAIQCHHRDQILEGIWCQLHQQVGVSGRF